MRYTNRGLFYFTLLYQLQEKQRSVSAGLDTSENVDYCSIVSYTSDVKNKR